MGEHNPMPEQLAGRLQRIAHISQQEKFGWRNAVGMRGDPALADVNSPIREKLAQMVIGPAVAEPKFQDLPIQFTNQTGRKIETSALRLKPANEAVEAAHGQSGGDPGAFAQSFDLGKGGAQLMVRRIEPVRQFLHDRDRHAGEFADHAHKRLL